MTPMLKTLQWGHHQMRSLIYALLIIIPLAILASCKPQDDTIIIVTATPGETPTEETATWTPEPTATDEIDGVSLPINRNAGLGPFESTLMPDFDHSNGIDRRQWDIPAGFNIVYDFPNPTSPRVFPFIFCNGDSRCQWEIGEIDGHFYYRVPQFEFETNQCYGVKIVAYTNIELLTTDSMIGLAVSARLESDTDEMGVIDLGRRPVSQFGLLDEFYPFWTDLSRPVASVEIGFAIDFPAYGGEIVVDEVSIRKASPGYCNGVDPWG